MFSTKKKLILDVLLNPNTKNSFEIGAGYTVDTGPRAKIIWKKPWINTRGHSLENNFSLSTLEQIIDLSYKIPLLHSPLEQYFLLQGGLIHEDIHNIQSSIITINLSRHWNYFDNWQSTMHVHWRFNRCTQNCVTKNTILIYPGISVYRIRKRGESIPYWGDSQRYSINISNDYWKSNINFFAIQAQNIWVRTFFKNHRFLVRGNLSWIGSNDLSSIASILRFFSNMDSGIRGYKHKFLYPYDNNSACFVKTANKLITSAFEYQYNIINKWWSVIFIDIGEITNNIKWNNLKSGMGIGVRWQLPIGTIKLDVATPLIYPEKINHHFLYVYVNLGPDL